MTHVVRTRSLTFCLAVLPAGIVFTCLLLFTLGGLSQTPSFSTHSFTSSAVNNSVVLHGDLNNDGYEDLIMSTSSSTTRVFLSKGNGTYTELAASISASPQLLADFNGDGKLDLIAGNQMYFGNGDGTFGSGGAISLPAGTLATAAADVNHDGKIYLLSSPPRRRCGQRTRYRYFLETETEAFRRGPKHDRQQSKMDVEPPSQFITGDFNGDGNVDVAMTSGWDPGWIFPYDGSSLFAGDGNGNFTPTSNDQDKDS